MSGQNRLIPALRRAYAVQRTNLLGASAPRWLIVLLTAAAVAAWIVLIALLAPRLFYGSDNLRALEAVAAGRDEAYVAGSAWGIWLHGPFTLSSAYGDLYYFLGWLALRVFAVFRQPSEHVAIVVLRSISLFSYVAFGAGMYFWVKRLAGPVAAAVALLLAASLTSSGDFAMRATACQPDMLNLALSALALVLIVQSLRKPTLKSAAAVGAAVGAVMAVKLSAVFVALLAGAALLVWSVAESADGIAQSRSASRRAALRLVAVLFAGSLFIAIAVALLSTRGHGLGRLPIPPSWPRTLGTAVYPLVLAAVFVIVYLVDRAAGAGGSWRARLAVFLERLVLMGCVAAIAFAILSPNAVIGLRFLGDLGGQSGTITSGGGGLVEWARVLTGGALLWLLPLSAVLAAFVVTGCVKRTSRRLDRDRLTLLIVLVWQAVALVTMVVLVSKARERFLYPLLPAFVLTAGLGVTALVSAIARWWRAKRLVSQLAVAAVVCVSVLLPVGLAVAAVEAQNERDYSDFARQPGYQVGLWLDDRFPADTSIMQNAGAYIPQRYADVAFLPGGDPAASLAGAKPDTMVVNLVFVTYADSMPRHEIDTVQGVEAGIVQDFYHGLLSGELGYTIVKGFPPTSTSVGFVILQVRSETPSGGP